MTAEPSEETSKAMEQIAFAQKYCSTALWNAMRDEPSYMRYNRRAQKEIESAIRYLERAKENLNEY